MIFYSYVGLPEGTSCYENIGPGVFLPRDARLTAVELRSARDILRSPGGESNIPSGNLKETYGKYGDLLETYRTYMVIYGCLPSGND